MNDLNHSVAVTDQVVDATPTDHPSRAAILNNLGHRFGTQFERTGSMDDLNCMLGMYEEGWRCRTAPHLYVYA